MDSDDDSSASVDIVENSGKIELGGDWSPMNVSPSAMKLSSLNVFWGWVGRNFDKIAPLSFYGPVERAVSP